MEIEVKILEIDPTNVRQRLKKIGASYLGKVFQRNFIYDYPDERFHRADGGYVRLRINEDFHTRKKEVLLTLKQTLSRERFKIAKEIETLVDSFEAMEEFLLTLGLVKRRLDEKIRESYSYQDILLEIDEWAGLPPYLEIEAPSETQVIQGLNLLGYSLEQATSKNLSEVLAMYNIEAEQLLFSDFGRSVFDEREG